MGLFADTGFDDPAAWHIDATLLPTAVTGGQLVIDASNGGTVFPVTQTGASIGQIYSYRIDVDSSVVPTGDIKVILAGLTLWEVADGSGLFTGSVTIVTQPYPIGYGTTIPVTGSGNAIFNSLSVDLVHVRQSIREALETACTGLTTTGTNVFPSAVYNLQESQLPALQIVSVEESIELENGTLDAPLRAFNVTVKGTAQATADVDNTLDDIAEEVETALGADITLGGLSHGLDLVATVFDFSGEGDQPIGSIELVYQVEYRTPFGDPTTVT